MPALSIIQKQTTMKQHYMLAALFTLLCVLFTQKVAGQQCRDYACVIAKVERLMQQPQKDYKAILDNLDSAEGYSDSKAEQIRTLRRRVFVLMGNEKNEAKRARDEAKKQMEIAQKALAQVEIEKQTAVAEKTKAQAAEAKAKAVLDKIYFYDDKFGLASKPFLGNPIYGFIDKELNAKIDFKYYKAFPFDDIGYAKVWGDYGKTALIIDTLGNEYRLATHINELDSNITALDLRNKNMGNISPSVVQHKQLSILLLNDNNIAQLPESVEKLRHLQSLNLRSNQLTNLPVTFKTLTNLKSLDLSSNQFTQFPNELFKLRQLQSLSLGNNPFENISLEGLGHLSQLQSLFLFNIKLNNLPTDFGKLKYLRFLNLNKNQLKTLPNSFGELKYLQKLVLGDNELTDFKDIGKLKSLQYLDLNNNKIETFPDDIKNLIYLKNLNLIGNPISEEEKKRLKKLLPNCDISFGDQLVSLDFNSKYIVIDTSLTIIMMIDNLLEDYKADTANLDVKIRLALQYNELAWFQLQTGQFLEAEKNIRQGILYDSTNVFLPTNLPTSLLLQGKYQEAEKEYTIWKNKAFEQPNLPLYKDVFLDDLNILERIGIIPKEQQSDVEKIKQLLTKN